MPSGAAAPERPAAPDASTIAIITALSSERRTLNPRAWLAAGGRTCTVLQSGPGPEAARSAAELAVRQGAAALVSWGLAGGLSPVTGTGTVVLPAFLVAAGAKAAAGKTAAPETIARETIPVTTAWHERVSVLLGDDYPWVGGRLVGVDAPVTSPAEKSRLADAFEAAAVDMESIAVGRVAQAAGLPFLVVRVIVDGPSDALPAAAAGFVSKAGNVRLIAALFAALRSSDDRRLMRELGRRSASAHAVLRQLARRLGPADFGLPDRVLPGRERLAT